MNEYKIAIEEFLNKIEELDSKYNFDNMSNMEIHLLNIIRACRNKLADTYNCIGDEDWELPNFEW